MILKKITVKDLPENFPDHQLIKNLKRDEPKFTITGDKRELVNDPIVELEISFRKCIRVGALRK